MFSLLAINRVIDSYLISVFSISSMSNSKRQLNRHLENCHLVIIKIKSRHPDENVIW